MLDLLRRPLQVGLLVCALAVAGFYAYQNVAMEFYYSWPYATMGAKVLASCDLESTPVEDGILRRGLTDGSVLVEDYRVLLEHEGTMRESVLHGVFDPSPRRIDETIFNSRALGSVSADLDGVWIDEGLARSLGVGLSDEIRLIQRITGSELSSKVIAIVPAYAPTRGIVAPSCFAAAMIPCSLSVYESDEEALSDFVAKAESAGVAVAVRTREDACQTARLMAREFLPFARSDALQIAAMFLSSGSSYLFFSAAIRRQTKRFFEPLMLSGLRPRKITAIVAAELGIAAVPISALAGLAAVAGLESSYGLPVSIMLFLSTAALLMGGFLVGGACATLARSLAGRACCSSASVAKFKRRSK